MAKKPEINPGQGSMFHQHDQIAEVAHAAIPDQADPTEPYQPPEPSIPTTYGKEGSYVNISERAGHLATALGTISARNQRYGFDYASNSEEHGGDIWARYRGGTPKVQQGAKSNAERMTDEVKREFWYSTGLGAMRSKHIIGPDRVESTARKFWREFDHKYGGTDPKGARKKAQTRYEKIAEQFPKPDKK